MEQVKKWYLADMKNLDTWSVHGLFWFSQADQIFIQYWRFFFFPSNTLTIKPFLLMINDD